MTIHICAPSPTHTSLLVCHCPTCNDIRQFLVEDFEWYGAKLTCLTCGDAWSDGEREERPFRRGWRKDAIAAALARAKRAGLEAG